jgi:hypothetical protein
VARASSLWYKYNTKITSWIEQVREFVSNFPFPSKGTGIVFVSGTSLFRLATRPLDFIMEHNATTSQQKPGKKGSQQKISKTPQLDIRIVRIRTKCLVPVGKLDALLDGSLELALEVSQSLLLKVIELTQTKHFLYSVLAKPYL